MPRSYGDKFLRELADNQNDDNNLGITLAKVCVRANLPLAYVAAALGVTKLSVFHWFRGRAIRLNYRNTVHAFISLVEKDLEAGRLPAANQDRAKGYIQEMIGRSF